MDKLVHYILKNGIAMPTNSVEEWQKQICDVDSRRVAVTEIHHCTVSTVFLGLDHNFGCGGLPLLFETMVFSGEMSTDSIDNGRPVRFQEDGSDQWLDMQRYSFIAEAIEGHHRTVRAIEKRFGQVEDKVSGLLYGIFNAEEWTRETE